MCASNTKTMGWGIMKNSAIIPSTIGRTFEATSTQYYPASGMGIVTCSVGDTLQFGTASYSTAGLTHNIINGGFTAVRIS